LLIAVSTFSTEGEAVALANDSEYGLAGAVISADEARCSRVSEALQCGIVWINCSQPCFCQVSFGCPSWLGTVLSVWLLLDGQSQTIIAYTPKIGDLSVYEVYDQAALVATAL
jgi:hypothetical protein